MVAERCQLRPGRPIKMQHEGFHRRRRSPAPQPRTPPHCHVRRGIARRGAHLPANQEPQSPGPHRQQPFQTHGGCRRKPPVTSRGRESSPPETNEKPGKSASASSPTNPGREGGRPPRRFRIRGRGPVRVASRRLRRRAPTPTSQSGAGAGGRALGGVRAYRGGAAGARSRGLAVPAAPTEAPRPLPTCCAALCSAWPWPR